MTCLLETFLNSSIQTNDGRISIDGYNLIWADHLSVSKRGGVSIYYKEHIPMIKQDEICSKSEKCFLNCAYRSPSQNQDESEDFCKQF